VPPKVIKGFQRDLLEPFKARFVVKVQYVAPPLAAVWLLVRLARELEPATPILLVQRNVADFQAHASHAERQEAL
jgi:hypothetical protein